MNKVINKLKLLEDIVSKIKKRENSLDFNSKKDMSGLCSYFSLAIIAELSGLGLKSEHLLLEINESSLDSSFQSNCYHNVASFDGYIIDITRKQFGDLIQKDVSKTEDYLHSGIKIKSTHKSTALNLKGFLNE